MVARLLLVVVVVGLFLFCKKTIGRGDPVLNQKPDGVRQLLPVLPPLLQLHEARPPAVLFDAGHAAAVQPGQPEHHVPRRHWRWTKGFVLGAQTWPSGRWEADQTHQPTRLTTPPPDSQFVKKEKSQQRVHLPHWNTN